MNEVSELNSPNPTVQNQVQLEPVEPQVPQPKRSVLNFLKDVFKNFYANKKLFGLTVAIVGLLFLTIMVGFIYSLLKRSTNKPGLGQSPAPSSASSSVNSEQNINYEALKKSKEGILKVDLNQKRLSPPQVNFDISF